MEELPLWFWPLLIVLQIWSAVWKGFALWKAARLYDKVWFVLFMFVNTAGILEIIYLKVISKNSTTGELKEPN